MHDASGASQDNCNMPCAGNPTQVCGDGNRVQIYEDASWSDTTAADLIAALKKLNATISQASDVVEKYNRDIQALQDYRASQGLKVKRQDGDPGEYIMLQDILHDDDSIQVVRSAWSRCY
jgi:hypothetical protein